MASYFKKSPHTLPSSSWKRKTKSFRDALPLSPRFEDPLGDDMDECEPPPCWNELSKEEKLEILDQQMDSYWEEYYGEIRKNINWWKYSTIFMGGMNIFLYLAYQI
tara:strand:- start:3545 stop:3862 length:318 start_codon:yes stop_codon:yes gene_type:complete